MENDFKSHQKFLNKNKKKVIWLSAIFIEKNLKTLHNAIES